MSFHLFKTIISSTFVVLFFAVLMPFSAQTIENKTLIFPSIEKNVIVRRDKRHIPYIEAKTEKDLYFAQGYLVASDRLWQMDLLRRTGRGELSEIFGKTVFEEDKRYRLYGFAKWSEGAFEKCSPEFQAVLKAYSEGVNAFINNLKEDDLPAEFKILGYRPRDWTPSDSLVVSRLFAVALGETWYDDAFIGSISDIGTEKLEKITTSISPFDVISYGSDKNNPSKKVSEKGINNIRSEFDLSTVNTARKTIENSLSRIGLGAKQLAMSNAWAVSGKHTESGKPLLANDPHLFPAAPSIWYLMHLNSPFQNVSGAATPGLPGIIIGRNDFISWGVTNLRADTQDLIKLEYADNYKSSVRTLNGLVQTEKSEEIIKVRKNYAGNEIEEVRTTLEQSIFGPVIEEANGNIFALKWSVLSEQSADAEAFYRINRAKNYQEWQSALMLYKGQPQSFVYADTSGNIAYQAAGTVPLREKGNGTIPRASSELKKGFTGNVPFSSLPQVLNPLPGIIISANNRMVGSDYRFLLTKMWIPPYRAKRISTLLTKSEKMNVEKFRIIQSDTFSNADDLFIREVKKALKTSADKSFNTSLSMIFDETETISSPESRQIALSNTARNIFTEKILDSLLGKDRAKDAEWTAKSTFIDNILLEKSIAFLPKEYRNYDELLLVSCREAMEKLTRQFGDDRKNWTWGKLGSYKFYHPLGSVPLIGQQFAFNPVPQFAGGSGGTINLGDEVSMRMIADLSDSKILSQSLSAGQSGDPKSPFYKDQLNDWRNVQLGNLFHQADLIADNAEIISIFSANKK